MYLYEYEGKKIFSSYGIPVPKGVIIRDENEPVDLTFPVVVKAQILTGGRGKLGGILFANDESELRKNIRRLLGWNVGYEKVEGVLVEEKIIHAKEAYLSISIDRNSGFVTLMASSGGGVDVEYSKDVTTIKVSPLSGLQDYALRSVVSMLDIDPKIREKILDIVLKMYRIFIETNATLVEINPLALTNDGITVALDSKIAIDDYCINKNQLLQEILRERLSTKSFQESLRRLGLVGIELDGNIAVIASGAGCLMATVDQLAEYGGSVRAVVDLGGSVFDKASLQFKLTACLDELAKLSPKVILINAFFQLADCGFFAQSLMKALGQCNITQPVIVRLKGNRGENIEAILRGEQIYYTDSFFDACRKAVLLSDKNYGNYSGRKQ